MKNMQSIGGGGGQRLERDLFSPEKDGISGTALALVLAIILSQIFLLLFASRMRSY